MMYQIPTEHCRGCDVGKRSRKANADGAVETNNPYAIGVLSKAFDILAIFSHSRPSLGLGKVVIAVRLPNRQRP
jgi:hypothetical protein